MSRMLTTKQAAEILGVTPARIRQFVLGGRLPATKFGRDLAIREEDLEALKDRKPGRPKGKRKKENTERERRIWTRCPDPPTPQDHKESGQNQKIKGRGGKRPGAGAIRESQRPSTKKRG